MVGHEGVVPFLESSSSWEHLGVLEHPWVHQAACLAGHDHPSSCQVEGRDPSTFPAVDHPACPVGDHDRP